MELLLGLALALRTGEVHGGEPGGGADDGGAWFCDYRHVTGGSGLSLRIRSCGARRRWMRSGARGSIRAGLRHGAVTVTSHASLMTGDIHRTWRETQMTATERRGPTLAETLRAAGFATGAFCRGFPLGRRFG